MRTIDARGHRCPVPTLKLRRALDGAPAGFEVRLFADDPMARIDVPHFAGENGHEVTGSGEVEDGHGLWFTVRKGDRSR